MYKVQKIRQEVARIQAYTQSDVLKEVLDYIDKVQEEPVSEDLNKEIEIWQDYYAGKNNPIQRELIKQVARHFSKWQKEQILECNTTLQRTFELGKQEMKKQMIKIAVEIPIIIADEEPAVAFALPNTGLKKGDKIKVIAFKK